MKFSGQKSELLYLLREVVRDPYLSLLASMRLALRGLEYLHDNPDVFILPSLLGEYRGKVLEQNTLFLIGRRDRLSVALLIRQSSDKGICIETISRDTFSEAMNSGDLLHLKTIVEYAEERYGFIDAAIFLSHASLRKIKMMILDSEKEDPFVVASLGFLDGIKVGAVQIWPRISTLEVLSQGQPKELVLRFANRFGLYPEYQRDLRKAAQGAKMLIRGLSPLVRRSPHHPPPVPQ